METLFHRFSLIVKGIKRIDRVVFNGHICLAFYVFSSHFRKWHAH